MTTITATVVDRRLQLEVPADWPDGTQVEIHPVHNGNPAADTVSPEEIAQLLAAMDRMEPLEFTDAERNAWEAQRQARKDWRRSNSPNTPNR